MFVRPSLGDEEENMRRSVTILLVACCSGMTMTTAPRRSGALIFDLDGTLVDSFELGFAATNDVLESQGFALVTSSEYLYGCRYCTPERLARHAGLVPEDSYFQSLGAELGAAFDAKYISRVSPTSVPLHENVRDLLERAAACGLALGCLTNAAVAYAEAVLATHGIRDMFRSVHGADSVARPKPYPDGLRSCCRELGVEPDRAVYVGDAPTDGAAARAALFASSIGVAWEGADRDALLESSKKDFDIVFDNVKDLEYALFVGPPGIDSDHDGDDFKAFEAHFLKPRPEYQSEDD